MARSRFVYSVWPAVHNRFTTRSRILPGMGDFFAVLGFIAFVVVMLGLVWGLDHV
jgi:hypothetical protein